MMSPRSIESLGDVLSGKSGNAQYNETTVIRRSCWSQNSPKIGICHHFCRNVAAVTFLIAGQDPRRAYLDTTASSALATQDACRSDEL